MNSGLFNIHWKDVLGAIVSAVIAAVLAYLSTLTNITDVSWSQIGNIAVLTAIASLAKAFTTDSSGRLLGGWKVK